MFQLFALRTGMWAAGVIAVALMLATVWWHGRSTGHEAGWTERNGVCVIELKQRDDRIAALQLAAITAERQAQAERENGRALADMLAKQARDTAAKIEDIRRRADRAIETRVSAARRLMDRELTSLLNSITPTRTSVSAGGGQAGAATAGAAGSVRPASADPAGSAGGYASERSTVRALKECRVGYAACADRHDALSTYVESITK